MHFHQTLIITAAVLFMQVASAYAYEGKVVDVRDDASIIVEREDGSTEVVRLYGVEFPDKGDYYFEQARGHLRNQCYGRNVRVQTVFEGSYGPTAFVHIGTRSISLNGHLISSGYARVNRSSCIHGVCRTWSRYERGAVYGKKGYSRYKPHSRSWKHDRFKHRHRGGKVYRKPHYYAPNKYKFYKKKDRHYKRKYKGRHKRYKSRRYYKRYGR